MRFVLVSTRNVQRFMDAARALEQRLQDTEIMGLGLVFGQPGLGKSMAMEAYHARSHKTKRVRTVLVRAMQHWTETSMLRGILRAIGEEPRGGNRDTMFDQLADSLIRRPALLLIDEIDAIAGSGRMMGSLKDIHDVTGSAILMIGEERVDAMLRRFRSFYNRMNRAAVAQLTDHTEEDVAAVIEQRCEVPTDPGVSAEIHAMVGGKSMRSVVDLIRDIEEFARTNNVQRIGVAEFRRMLHRGASSRRTVVDLPRPEAANG